MNIRESKQLPPHTVTMRSLLQIRYFTECQKPHKCTKSCCAKETALQETHNKFIAVLPQSFRKVENNSASCNASEMKTSRDVHVRVCYARQFSSNRCWSKLRDKENWLGSNLTAPKSINPKRVDQCESYGQFCCISD